MHRNRARPPLPATTNCQERLSARVVCACVCKVCPKWRNWGAQDYISIYRDTHIHRHARAPQSPEAANGRQEEGGGKKHMKIMIKKNLPGFAAVAAAAAAARGSEQAFCRRRGTAHAAHSTGISRCSQIWVGKVHSPLTPRAPPAFIPPSPEEPHKPDSVGWWSPHNPPLSVSLAASAPCCSTPRTAHPPPHQAPLRSVKNSVAGSLVGQDPRNLPSLWRCL